MPAADRAFASYARRPAIRAAALLWIWLTVVFAPVGATLHVMSHSPRQPLRAAAPADIAVAATNSAGSAHVGQAQGREDRATDSVGAADGTGGHPHGVAKHCHVCDEWQFLDHALPAPALPDGTTSATHPAVTPLALPRRTADAPWILPRAPPADPSRAA